MRYYMIAMAALLLLAACGQQASVSDGVDVKAGGPEVSVKDTDVAVKAGDAEVEVSGDSSSLESIIGKKQRLRWKASYRMTSEGESSEMTQVFDLPKYAMFTKVEGVESKLIFDGTDMISCSNQNGWQCFKISSPEAAGSMMESMDMTASVEARVGEAGVTVVGSCSRAGESGTKFRVTDAGVVSSVCYASDGLLLELESKSADGSDFSMVATSVGRTVTSADFTPPAEPVDIASLVPGGIPGMG